MKCVNKDGTVLAEIVPYNANNGSGWWQVNQPTASGGVMKYGPYRKFELAVSWVTKHIAKGQEFKVEGQFNHILEDKETDAPV